MKRILTIGYGADLNAALGDRYRDYRHRVPMLIPGLHRRRQQTAPDTTVRPA